MSIRRKGLWAALIAAAVAAAVYSPVLRADFVWDDLTVQRDQIPHFRTVRDAFFPPAGIMQWSGAYYRPLVMLTYQLDGRVNDALLGEAGSPGGELDARRAAVPHATTLLAHVAATLLVSALALRLLRGRKGDWAGALAAGLLFAVHPVHAESVGSIAGRSDILATAFLLAGLLAALRFDEKGGAAPLLASAAAFLCAFLAKEAALAGLALLPLLLWFSAREGGAGAESRGGRRIALAGGVAAAAAAYLLLRVLAGYTGLGGAEATGGIGRLLPALAYYVGEGIAPGPMLPVVRELPSAGWTAFWLALAAAGTGAAFLYARRGERLPLLASAWFLLALAPSLAVAVSGVAEAPVAERYLYLPSVGLSLLAAWAVARGAALPPMARKIGIAAGAGLLTLSAWAASDRAQAWRDDLSFWGHAARTVQGAREGIVWLNLGTAHQRRERWDAAIEAYRRALDPAVRYTEAGRALALNNLASSLNGKAKDAFTAGRLEEAWRLMLDAEGHYRRSIGTNPAYPSPYVNLGVLETRMGRIAKMRTGRYDVGRLEEARALLLRGMELRKPDAYEREALAACEQLLREAKSEKR